MAEIEATLAKRKAFYVMAIRVTAENFDKVAVWCEGKATTTYIEVVVPGAKTKRQTKAYVGDWILQGTSGFKVYTDKAYHKAFDEVSEEVCGRNTGTADGKPCVLGVGHTYKLGMTTACRSLSDYLVLTPSENKAV